MATESDLRDLLQGPDPEGRAAIDLDAVLTRARKRRRPKLIAVQALGSVAVVGGLFTAVVATLPPQQQAASLLVQESSGGAADYSVPADDEAKTGALDLCGEPPTSWPLLGWGLDVTDGGAVSAADPVLTVTLRNDMPMSVSGEVELTRVAFIRDDVVVAHGVPSAPQAVSTVLDADESLTWDVPISVVTCDGTSLDPGAYDVRASVDVRREDGTAEPVVGAPGAVELR